jgi:hypothetical protein
MIGLRANRFGGDDWAKTAGEGVPPGECAKQEQSYLGSESNFAGVIANFDSDPN